MLVLTYSLSQGQVGRVVDKDDRDGLNSFQSHYILSQELRFVTSFIHWPLIVPFLTLKLTVLSYLGINQSRCCFPKFPVAPATFNAAMRLLVALSYSSISLRTTILRLSNSMVGDSVCCVRMYLPANFVARE